MNNQWRNLNRHTPCPQKQEANWYKLGGGKWSTLVAARSRRRMKNYFSKYCITKFRYIRFADMAGLYKNVNSTHLSSFAPFYQGATTKKRQAFQSRPEPQKTHIVQEPQSNTSSLLNITYSSLFIVKGSLKCHHSKQIRRIEAVSKLRQEYTTTSK